MGSKSRTRNYITKLRDDERSRYLVGALVSLKLVIVMPHSFSHIFQRDVYGFKESESAPSLETTNVTITAVTTTDTSSSAPATEGAAVDSDAVVQSSETNGADDNGNSITKATRGEQIATDENSQQHGADHRHQDYGEEDEGEEESPNFLDEDIAMTVSY